MVNRHVQIGMNILNMYEYMWDAHEYNNFFLIFYESWVTADLYHIQKHNLIYYSCQAYDPDDLLSRCP